jgi:hypothetical protein
VTALVSVICAFCVIAALGIVGVGGSALLRGRVSYSTFIRCTQLAVFTLAVGVFGFLVGLIFWMHS